MLVFHAVHSRRRFAMTLLFFCTVLITSMNIFVPLTKFRNTRILNTPHLSLLRCFEDFKQTLSIHENGDETENSVIMKCNDFMH